MKNKTGFEDNQSTFSIILLTEPSLDKLKPLFPPTSGQVCEEDINTVNQLRKEDKVFKFLI